MTRLARTTLAMTVVVSFVLPSVAEAQAKSRGGGSSGSGPARAGSIARAPAARPASGVRPAPSRSAGTAKPRALTTAPSTGRPVPARFGVGFNSLAWHHGYGFGHGVYGFGRYGTLFGTRRYGYGNYYGGYSSGGYRTNAADRALTGFVRLRMSPHTAKVYVDGALVGMVDEFDGLTGHLELDHGAHHLEVRADGYVPYVTTVSVRAGRTVTERTRMQRIQK